MIENRPERIDVGGRADFSAGGLLRWHVARRAHHLAGRREPAVSRQLLRQSEVGDFRLASSIQKHIGWFQIAVDHAAIMGKLNRLGDLLDERAASRGGIGPAATF